MPRCKECGHDGDIPPLEANAGSVKRFISWVGDATAHGLINPNQAKELNNAASKMLTAIKVDEGLREMDELRELVRRAVEAADKRAKNEAEDRYEQGEDTKGSYELER